jgi:predicted P-loop ATPase
MSASAGSGEFIRAMGPVARELLGDPSEENKAKQELRYGTRGSLCIDLSKGTWFDNEAGEGGGLIDFVRQHKSVDKHGALAWLQERGHVEKSEGSKRIVATYDYTGATGELLFQVVRFDPKDFRQRRPDGNGGWIWNLKGVERVPYRLPELLSADRAAPVFIPEGEKDVDRLRALGLAATCNAGGASKWTAPLSRYLSSRTVVILPDNDDAGEKHALDVQRKLRGPSGPQFITIVRLPNLPPKGDVSDWLDAGGTVDDLMQIIQEERQAEISDLASLLRPNQRDEHFPKSEEVQSGAAAQTAVIEARGAYHELRDKLAKTDEGAVRSTHSNLLLILKGDPLLTGLVGLDAFSGRHLIFKPVPVLDKILPPAPGPYPRAWDAGDVTRLLAYVQKEWASGIKRGAIEECLIVEGQDRQFHPVRDWLATLHWDRIPRIDKWLTMTFGCALDDYHKAVGSKLLIAAVRRVRQPGCKFDHLPVLEGAQGIGKSRAIGILFGEDWTTDDVPADLGNKDAAIALAGVWAVELSEIEPLIRSEAETVKAFLSRGTDRYRPPYGRTTIEVARQCVLIGTTNATEYLRDTTGNRRIWPVQCLSTDSADLGWLRTHRDQLWAEAAHREVRGEAIWLNIPHVHETAIAAQAARLADDPWSDRVVHYIAALSAVKVPEILDRALFIDTPHQDKRSQMRVTDILKAAGWKRNLAWDDEAKKPVREWNPPT